MRWFIVIIIEVWLQWLGIKGDLFYNEFNFKKIIKFRDSLNKAFSQNFVLV